VIVDNQIIVPDMEATQEVDLVELRFRGTKERAEGMLEKLEKDVREQTIDVGECRKAVKLTREALDAANEGLGNYKPEPDNPRVVIGYIPPRKLTSLRHAQYVVNRQQLEAETATREQLDGLDDIAREYLRWGIKGHSGLGCDFEQEKEKAGPREYDVATWEMVDIYEGIEMLQDLFHEVMAYNSLAEKKRKQSSSKPGIEPTTSTADCAASSPP
jgi:hypothetical protein